MESRGSAGYTIVEVIIVLAVTSALFIGTAAAMSGRQARMEFTNGVRALESRISTVANEVSSGYYDNGYQCRTPGNSAPQVRKHVPADPGGNIDCIFLGKVMQFNQDAETFKVYTLVGRRVNTSSFAVTSLNEARPTVVDGQGIQPDLTAQIRLEWGVRVYKMLLKGPTTQDIGGFGYLNQLTGDIAGGNPVSGSRSLELVAVTGTDLTSNQPAMRSQIENISASPGMVNADGGIVLCLSGRSGQKAQLNIGGSRGRSATEVLMDGNVSSDC